MRVIGNAVCFLPISSTGRGRRRRNRSEIRFQPNCLLVVVASLSVYSSFSLAFCFLPCARSESIFPTILLPPPTPAGRSSRNKPGLVSSLLPGGRFSATERNRREAPRASPVVGVKRRCRLLLPLRGRRRQCGGQGRGRNGVEAASFLSSVLNLRRKMAIESASQSIVARLRSSRVASSTCPCPATACRACRLKNDPRHSCTERNAGFLCLPAKGPVRVHARLNMAVRLRMVASTELDRNPLELVQGKLARQWMNSSSSTTTFVMTADTRSAVEVAARETRTVRLATRD
jgi:hypothetical protein